MTYVITRSAEKYHLCNKKAFLLVFNLKDYKHTEEQPAKYALSYSARSP